jgi:hypothetical protein
LEKVTDFFPGQMNKHDITDKWFEPKVASRFRRQSWECGSSGRALMWHASGPEFNPQYREKKGRKRGSENSTRCQGRCPGSDFWPLTPGQGPQPVIPRNPTECSPSSGVLRVFLGRDEERWRREPRHLQTPSGWSVACTCASRSQQGRKEVRLWS